MDHSQEYKLTELEKAVSLVAPSEAQISLPQHELVRSKSDIVKPFKKSGHKTICKRRLSICPNLAVTEWKDKHLNIHRHFEVEESDRQQKSTSVTEAEDQSQSADQSPAKQKHHENERFSERTLTILRNFIKTLRTNLPKVYKTVLCHLSKMGTADKYIRLINSLFKIDKALNEKSRFKALSKQLNIAREVVQWESKYSLIRQFRQKDLSVFDVGFKTLEFTENISDFVAFWVGLLNKNGNKTADSIVSTLEQWSSDCYFFECCISLSNYTWNMVSDLKDYLSIKIDQKSLREAQEAFSELQTQYNDQLDALQHMKKCFKVHQSRKRNEVQQQEKIARAEADLQAAQKEFKEAGGNFHIQMSEKREEARKSMVKHMLKVAKFILDGLSSHNNYSKRFFKLEPLTVSKVGFVSSILSMYLLWRY